MNINPSENHHQKEWDFLWISDSIIDGKFWSICDFSQVNERLNRNTDNGKKWQHSTQLVSGQKTRNLVCLLTGDARNNTKQD